MPLPRAFYDRPTLLVARDLIGKLLVHDTPAGRASGLIVEAEAYIGESDPACHAAAGLTPRTAPLYGPPGIAYVYFNYGMHHLVNAVTEAEGSPAAVLIRALQPVDGIPLMRRRRTRGTGRPAASLEEAGLCRGPGNLTKALGITLAQNRLDLLGPALFIEEPGALDGGDGGEAADAAVLAAGAETLAWSERIGISVGRERLWRCFVAGHPAVSGRVAPAARLPRDRHPDL